MIKKKIKLIKIGEGSFSTAYATAQLDKAYVLSVDKVKAAYAAMPEVDSPLIPKVEICRDFTEEDTTAQWYVMPLYTKVKYPESQLKYGDLKLYKALREIFVTRDALGYETLYKEFNNLAISDCSIGEDKVNALLSLLDAVATTVDKDCISFEISPRNIALNERGEMVLLDCFFCYDQLQDVLADEEEDEEEPPYYF